MRKKEISGIEHRRKKKKAAIVFVCLVFCQINKLWNVVEINLISSYFPCLFSVVFFVFLIEERSLTFYGHNNLAEMLFGNSWSLTSVTKNRWFLHCHLSEFKLSINLIYNHQLSNSKSKSSLISFTNISIIDTSLKKNIVQPQSQSTTFIAHRIATKLNQSLNY